MSLHLVFSSSGWQACSQRLQEGDAVILIGDGVYLARSIQISTHVADNLYALDEDMLARGVRSSAESSSRVSVVDYAKFVELTTLHHPIVSWND